MSYIPAPGADAPAVNPNGIQTLVASGLSTLFIKGKPVFSNGSSSLPRNPSYCSILDNCVFDNFILIDQLFSKALQSLDTCISINNNFMWKISLIVRISNHI